MTAYYAVCAGLATLSLLVIAATIIATALELRKSVRKVGSLAGQLDDRLKTLENVGSVIDHFTRTVRSGWMRGAEFIVGLASALHESSGKRGKGGRDDDGEEDGEEEKDDG